MGKKFFSYKQVQEKWAEMIRIWIKEITSPFSKMGYLSGISITNHSWKLYTLEEISKLSQLRGKFGSNQKYS